MSLTNYMLLCIECKTYHRLLCWVKGEVFSTKLVRLGVEVFFGLLRLIIISYLPIQLLT